MAKKLDPKELASFEKLLISNTIEVKTLTQLLEIQALFGKNY